MSEAVTDLMRLVADGLERVAERKAHRVETVDGEICLEWWGSGSRKVTVYVEQMGVMTYVRSWGPDMVNEMDDGRLVRNTEIKGLMTWLGLQESSNE